nr:hypothetical protein DGKKSRWO_DGKKSRWO_CDS_0006 [uncultured phage]CAI9752102.1 hypothetical protein CVNMHQAP_CVNMHQAP_CDS_0006 [uncultured phage]
MAEINDREFNRAADVLTEMTRSVMNNATTLKNASQDLSKFSQDTLNSIKNALLDSETVSKNIIDIALKLQLSIEDNILKSISSVGDKIKLLDEQIGIATDPEVINRYKEQRDALIAEQEEYQEKLKILHTDGVDALADHNAKVKAQQQVQEDQAKQAEQIRAREIENHNQFVDKIGKAFETGLRQITSIFSNGIDSVTSAYESSAGKLSAMLNTSVSDISRLQNNIASALRSSDLSSAISNAQILSEATSLAAAGYTNVDTLQQNAIDIAIGKQIAPTVDFNNQSVRNLINVFGSDFTHKFAAIAQSTQQTAGSTVGMAETLSTLMSNLEPVYLNAELQTEALQGTSDVTATLAAAQQQGIISEKDAATYRTLITELMDPSKAFKSSNVAVLAAASTMPELAFSGNPADALQALITARQQMYSGLDTSTGYGGAITRSLAAGAYGENTLGAAYNLRSLTDVAMVRGADLETTYQEQLEKVSGDSYTTRAQQIKNAAENAAMVQALSSYAKNFPIIYKTASAALLTAVNTLPTRIAKAMHLTISSDGNITYAGDDGNGGLFGAFLNLFKKSKKGETAKHAADEPAVGGLKGLLSKQPGYRTSDVALGTYAAGIYGVATLGSSIAQEGFNAQGLGMGGDYFSSITSYAGIGAAAGTLFGGGPIGTIVGGLIGVAAGLGTAIWANIATTQEQTKAAEEQTRTMKDTLGEGITSLSSYEAALQTASGGGYLTLSDGGNYAIDTSYYNIPGKAGGMDYVPYDNYLVRLHRGEAVVTANAAKELRKADPGFWHSPAGGVGQNDDVVYKLDEQTQSIVNAIHGDDDKQPMYVQGPKQYTIKNTSIA